MREWVYRLLDYRRQRRSRLTFCNRLRFRFSHEVCCHFDQYLASFLAPRLRWYVKFMREPDSCWGSPPGYPDPDDLDMDTDHDQWLVDVERACTAAENRAKGCGDLSDEEEDKVRKEWRWALTWLARWSGGVWV